MKEIELKELANYNLFKEYGTIALASDTKETNGLTIGWGNIGLLWRLPIATVYVNEARYSKHIFDNAKYFSINMFKKGNHDEAVEYYGKVSGRDEDKIKNGGIEITSLDNNIYYKDADVVILCEKVGQVTFDPNQVELPEIKEWYAKSGPHTSYFGKVIKVLTK